MTKFIVRDMLGSKSGYILARTSLHFDISLTPGMCNPFALIMSGTFVLPLSLVGDPPLLLSLWVHSVLWATGNHMGNFLEVPVVGGEVEVVGVLKLGLK